MDQYQDLITSAGHIYKKIILDSFKEAQYDLSFLDGVFYVDYLKKANNKLNDLYNSGLPVGLI